jgi:hypothetical protein
VPRRRSLPLPANRLPQRRPRLRPPPRWPTLRRCSNAATSPRESRNFPTMSDSLAWHMWRWLALGMKIRTVGGGLRRTKESGETCFILRTLSLLSLVNSHVILVAVWADMLCICCLWSVSYVSSVIDFTFCVSPCGNHVPIPKNGRQRGLVVREVAIQTVGRNVARR